MERVDRLVAHVRSANGAVFARSSADRLSASLRWRCAPIEGLENAAKDDGFVVVAANAA
jgi:hypothetical protein